MHCGENGILRGAEYAVDKYQNKAEQEQQELAKVDDYINNSRETVTLTNEEYQIFKNQITFSEEEKQIGTWQDGKKLYKCSYNLQDITVNSTQKTSTICDFTNKELIRVYGYCTWGDTKIVLPYYYCNPSNSIILDIFVDKDNICKLRTWRNSRKYKYD